MTVRLWLDKGKELYSVVFGLVDNFEPGRMAPKRVSCPVSQCAIYYAPVARQTLLIGEIRFTLSNILYRASTTPNQKPRVANYVERCLCGSSYCRPRKIVCSGMDGG